MQVACEADLQFMLLVAEGRGGGWGPAAAKIWKGFGYVLAVQFGKTISRPGFGPRTRKLAKPHGTGSQKDPAICTDLSNEDAQKIF